MGLSLYIEHLMREVSGCVCPKPKPKPVYLPEKLRVTKLKYLLIQRQNPGSLSSWNKSISNYSFGISHAETEHDTGGGNQEGKR